MLNDAVNVTVKNNNFSLLHPSAKGYCVAYSEKLGGRLIYEGNFVSNFNNSYNSNFKYIPIYIKDYSTLIDAYILEGKTNGVVPYFVIIPGEKLKTIKTNCTITD